MTPPTEPLGAGRVPNISYRYASTHTSCIKKERNGKEWFVYVSLSLSLSLSLSQHGPVSHQLIASTLDETTVRVLDVSLARLHLDHHTTLTAHLRRLGLVPDPCCSTTEDTLDHLMLQCPRLHAHPLLLRNLLLALNVNTFNLPCPPC